MKRYQGIIFGTVPFALFPKSIRMALKVLISVKTAKAISIMREGMSCLSGGFIEVKVVFAFCCKYTVFAWG